MEIRLYKWYSVEGSVSLEKIALSGLDVVRSYEVFFNDISERDMDLLFIEELAANPGFLSLFARKAGLEGHIEIVSTELSKKDPVLGESDMTVILRNGEEEGEITIWITRL